MQNFAVFITLLAVAFAQKSMDIESLKPIEIAAPLPLEVGQPAAEGVSDGIKYPDAVFDVPQPSVNLVQHTVELPKGTPEIYDVPNHNLAFPGNSVQEKKVILNIPSPIIEAPKPIIQTKPALFKLPQVIIQVPSPVVQHKPILYKVPHTLLINTPEVHLNRYHVAIPQLKIVKGSKSSYTQPIPSGKTEMFVGKHQIASKLFKAAESFKAKALAL